jgi:outer membrane protein OmpA-like peptidoglycan-associated protein/ABC-type nitrate/sulfonate/bicarbonate transport system substrate-binding protein
MVTKGKIVLAAIAWLILLAIGVSLWRLVIVPMRSTHQLEQAREQAEQQLAATSGASPYRYELQLGLDSFSGYAVLRSDEFRKQLAARGIKIKNIDDGANYQQRAAELEKGQLQLAAFPADALLKAYAKSDYPAATIVAILDETRGADAMLAYKQTFPDVDRLNRSDVKFILVGDSPSETLARVVMQDFGLSQISPQAIVTVTSPEQLLQRYRAATPSTPEVFVTWEPYVSQILANDQVGVLIDSSRFTGYIIDTLVVSRDFLLKNPAVVDGVLESYFTALYAYREPETLTKLLLDDAKLTKTELTEAQARNLVSGIQWKITQENFAHFGKRAGAVVHIEDMLARIATVLGKSGSIPVDAFEGRLNRYFFDRPIETLQRRNFHPGLANESVREESKLASLSDTQWGSLVTVGTLSVPELVFVRGSATLSDPSKRTLDDLFQKLQAWPQYYLMIRGNASRDGDPQANLRLAQQRGDAALKYLLGLGIPPERMRVVTGEITGQTRVTFVVGQQPF